MLFTTPNLGNRTKPAQNDHATQGIDGADLPGGRPRLASRPRQERDAQGQAGAHEKGGQQHQAGGARERHRDHGEPPRQRMHLSDADVARNHFGSVKQARRQSDQDGERALQSPEQQG
jgi:hypothetical protein